MRSSTIWQQLKVEIPLIVSRAYEMCSSNPRNPTTWCWMSSREVACSIFVVFSMTQLGIEPITSQSQGRHTTPRLFLIVRFKIINMSKYVAYFQTEDHQAEVPCSRNLKIWFTPNTGFKELCHLNPLKKIGTIYSLFWNHKNRFNSYIYFWKTANRTEYHLRVWHEPEGFSVRRSA